MSGILMTIGGQTARDLSNNPNFVSEEFLKGSRTKKHKFDIGEIRTLTGLTEFPEFNGQKVKITAIRQNGSRGRAYYIKGKINKFLNWVYEYRLK